MLNDRPSNTGSAQTSWTGFTSPEMIKRAKEYAKHKALHQLVDYIDIDKLYKIVLTNETKNTNLYGMQETQYTVTITIWEL